MVWACFMKGQDRLSEKRMDYEVEGIRARGRPKKTCMSVYLYAEADCQSQDVLQCLIAPVSVWTWSLLPANSPVLNLVITASVRSKLAYKIHTKFYYRFPC